MMSDRNDAIGLRIWEGPEQHRVHDCIDRDSDPDAECQREHGDGAESRIPGQGPARVSQVTAQVVRPHLASRLVKAFLRAYEIARGVARLDSGLFGLHPIGEAAHFTVNVRPSLRAEV